MPYSEGPDSIEAMSPSVMRGHEIAEAFPLCIRCIKQYAAELKLVLAEARPKTEFVAI